MKGNYPIAWHISCFNLVKVTLVSTLTVILFKLVSYVDRLLHDSQLDCLVCNAMTVYSRAVVDSSVGLHYSSNAELQLQGAWEVQGKVRKLTKDTLNAIKRISILICASYNTKKKYQIN